MIIKSGRIYSYIDYDLRARCKLIAGYYWHDPIKQWSWPLSSKARVISVFPFLQADIEREETRYRQSMIDMANAKKNSFANLEIDTSIYKRAPRSKQIIMTKNLVINPHFALFCACGTGKTQGVINAYDSLHRDKLATNCLIVCPKTAMDVWDEEININSDYTSIMIDGTKPKRLKSIATKQNFYIINYDGLTVLKDYEHWDKFDMVVLDESSRIKNRNANRTKFVLDKLRDAARRYILTATPITQSPLDMYSQFKFVNPAIFSHRTYGDFKAFYCILEKHDLADGRSYYEIKGFKNLDDLRRRIKFYSMELKIEDCEDLPGKIYTRRSLEMTPPLKKQYNDMVNNAFINTPAGKLITGKQIITQRIRMHQILSGMHLEDQKYNMKLMELENIIDENLHSGNQITVCCRWLPSMDIIEKMLRSKRIGYSELRGATKDRKEQIARFQSGATKVMVIQLRVGGISVTLTAGNITVYYENSFSLEDRRQTEGREYRIGQTKKVTYIDLVYKGTIDMDILYAIKNKVKISDHLIKAFKAGKTKGGTS